MRPTAGPHGGHRRLELAAVGRRQRRIGAEHRGQPGQPLLGALDELCLELHEPVDHARSRHDIDLVEAQLDPRAPFADDPLAPELADGHQLEQRGVAGELEHERPGIRGRPVQWSGRPVGRPLELLATHRSAGSLGPFGALDRDDRAATGLPQADGEARPAECTVGGVDVAVLELRRAQSRGPGESADLLGRQVAFGGCEVHHAVLELDLDRISDRRVHARGSSEPAPAPGRRGAVTTPP